MEKASHMFKNSAAGRSRKATITAILLAAAAIGLLAGPKTGSEKTAAPEAKIEPVIHSSTPLATTPPANSPINRGTGEQGSEVTPKPKTQQPTEKITAEAAKNWDAEIWKAKLQQILGQPASSLDYKVLEAIIQCESGWEHYYTRGPKIGQVKVSSGNVGFGQINNPTWRKFFAKTGLDYYKPLDNLKATVVLYQRSGVTPWESWSGHCWLTRLQNQNIDTATLRR